MDSLKSEVGSCPATQPHAAPIGDSERFWRLPVRSGMLFAVMNHDARQFAIEVARIASDHKAERVVTFDLRGISPVTEYVVICTGTSERQMRTVTETLEEYGKKLGQRPFGLAGRQSEVWTLIDFVDVVFHIFGRAHRDYYDLELLWGDAPRIDWARSESA